MQSRTHCYLRRLAALPILLSILLSAPILFAQAAQELKPIPLPSPQTSGGKPLLSALSERKTTREFSDKPLPLQTLSNLLWAAFGVNRGGEVKQGLGRTAPSAGNKQEVELWVVLAEGVYVYDAEANVLRPQFAGDIRAKIGPPAAGNAPVTIAYVADVKYNYAQVDTGFIGQNVYLFAASEGLNAWFHAFHGDEQIAPLKLPAEKHALYAQSVGYPQ